jgi:hypothetical protein
MNPFTVIWYDGWVEYSLSFQTKAEAAEFMDPDEFEILEGD